MLPSSVIVCPLVLSLVGLLCYGEADQGSQLRERPEWDGLVGNGNFLGRRYAKNDDRAIILLFDVKGYIAGLQTGYAKSVLPEGFPLSSMQQGTFQEDGDYLTTTVYFVDPAKICSTGRRLSQFLREGTGTNYHLQTGSDPLSQFVLVPRQVEDLNVSTGWTWKRGHCAPTMGYHYYYLEEHENCDTGSPVTLLYEAEQGRLVAFNFFINFRAQESPYFEAPKDCSAMPGMAALLPKCVCDAGVNTTSIHVWTVANPQTIPGCSA